MSWLWFLAKGYKLPNWVHLNKRSFMLFKEIESCHSWSMTIIGMNLPMSKVISVFFIKVTVMLQININRHHIDRLCLLNSKMLGNWLISSEIWRLVHIKPYTWKRNFFIQSIKLSFPEISRVRMKVIDKVNCSWPYLSNVVLIIISWISKKNVQFFTQINTFSI